MLNYMMLIIIICSLLGLMVIAGIIGGVYIYLRFRHWIFVITKSNRITFLRNYKLGGQGFEIKKGKPFAGEYVTPPGTLGSFRGQMAVFVRDGVPGALLWPIPSMGDKRPDGKPFFFWDFITGENMVEIMNTKHVNVVARAGQKDDPLRDIIVMVLLFIIAIMCLFIALKVFGVIKGNPSQVNQTISTG